MLKLAEANRAIAAAQAYAHDHGYAVSVTVCDSMGHLIAHGRMDDALALSSYGSIGKAIASAGLGIPSGDESDVDLTQSPVALVLGHGLAVVRRPGGLPVISGGEVSAAIGVSGAPTDEQDEECARHAIEAIRQTAL